MRTILAGCLALIAGACSQESSGDERAIRATYDQYKAAILSGRGADAVKLLDENTIDYYGQMLELARSGTEKEVRARSVIDKITILMLRHRVSRAQLAKMGSRSTFVFAVDAGSIGKNAVINKELGDVVISGDHATGVHVTEGKVSKLKNRFARENGEWKLDLTSLFAPVNMAMRRVIAESGKSEDKFIVAIVEITSGTDVAEDVWKSRNGG